MQHLKNQKFSVLHANDRKEALVGNSIIFSLIVVTIFINSSTHANDFSFPIFLLTAVLLVFISYLYVHKKGYLRKYFEINLGFYLNKKELFKFSVFSAAILTVFLLLSTPERIENIDITQLLPLAIQEEILFRFLIPCILCSFLRNKSFLPWAFLISSIIFSLFHLPDTVFGAFYYLYTGILFSVVAYNASFAWTVVLHVQINILLTFFSFDYNNVYSLLIYVAATLLITYTVYIRMLAKRCVTFKQNRNVSIDCLRAFALILIVLDNLTLYSWGFENKFLYSTIQIFGNFGYFIFLCLLGYSVTMSISSSKSSQCAKLYDTNLLKIGILNTLFFFSFDILIQLAIISILLRKISFWRSLSGLIVSLVSLSLLLLSSPFSVRSEYALMVFPSNIIMDPLNFYSDGLINLLSSILTLPLYIGIPGLLIYILPRVSEKKDNYIFNILFSFSIFVFLGAYKVFTNFSGNYTYVFEIIRTYALLHLVIFLVLYCANNQCISSKFRYISKIGSSTLSGYILSGIIISLSQVIFLNTIYQFYVVAIFCLISIIFSPMLRQLEFSFEEIRRTC